jgi:hypothetical protein
MDITERLVRARIAFMEAHDGHAPRVARVNLTLANLIRERLAAMSDHFPVDGRQMHGMLIVEDANQADDLVLE